MVVKKPPKDLTSFEGRKWLQQISFAAGGEVDPIFTTWRDAYDNHGQWNIAYNWGNHAEAGYITSETDPVAMQYLDQEVKQASTPTFNGATFNNDITLKAGCKIYLDGE